jgi:hypothetical protein
MPGYQMWIINILALAGGAMLAALIAHGFWHAFTHGGGIM